MKAGSSLTPEEQDGRVILHVKNEREKAWLEIDIHAVYDSLVRRLEDGKRLQLSGNERDMSDYIRDNPHVISAEFTPIGREQQTDVGFIDVFGHDRSGRLIVIECKRVTASLAAADQLRRYVRRVKQVRGTDNVHGSIAAPAITPNALKMLERWEFEFRMVVPPKRLGRWEEGQQRLL